MTTLANKFAEEVLTVDYTVASTIVPGSVLVFGPGVKYEVKSVKSKGRMIHVDAFRPDKKQERTFKLARNSKVGLLVQEPELEEAKRKYRHGDLWRKLLALRSQFAKAAQKVYDAWDQDEDGMDDEYGAGGICQDIADAMADVVTRRLRGADAHIVDNNGMGDQHVWIVVVQGDEKYAVDIPPGVYEKGGGYTWKKIPDVEFDAQDVDVYDAPDFEPEESVQEDYKSAPKMGGKQIIKIGTFGRFTAYSAVEGGTKGVFTKQQALDQNLQDPLLANVDIDIPHFLKRVDAAMSKLKMPKHQADVVFSDYPGSKTSVSGWMYPSIKSTVFLNRVLSPTALSKYAAWKGPRSPHTLVHEYAHDVWYQVLSPKQRQAVTDYYNQHVKPNKAEAVKKLISPTDYGASVDTEWWAEIVAYSIHPGRVAQEVLDFIVDVMTNKFDTASTKAAAPAKSKEATISTPAPKDEPDTPVGKLIAAGASAIKKEIGDYKLDPRPDGSVRIIPADKGKAHDGGVMAKLAMALGFNRHSKSPFKVRTSTGSQGGIVLFPESTTDAHMNAVIAEIEDNEPWDYVDEAGLATVLGMVGLATRERRVPLTHIAKLPVGTEFELRRASDPNTRSYWLHYRRTENGLALLDARGETVTAPNREAMLLDYAIELVRQGAKVRAPKTA